jgi:hypothetical protein
MVSLIVAMMLAGTMTSGLPGAATGGTTPDGIIAGVSYGTPPAPGSASSQQCSWKRANPYDANMGHGGEVSKIFEGRRYWLFERRCDDVDDLRWIPEITSGELGQEAAAEVERRLPPVQLMTAPPQDRGVVHVPMWFWVPPSTWSVVEATAWVPTVDGVLWATVRATPSHLWFDPGDGMRGTGPVTCAGPGAAWRPVDGDRTASSCSATYRASAPPHLAGRFNAALQVVWSASWWASTGAGGPLGTLTSVTSAPISVHEIHALVSR